MRQCCCSAGLAQAVDDWLPQLAAWLAASACR
jgi:hypothetical protein